MTPEKHTPTYVEYGSSHIAVCNEMFEDSELNITPYVTPLPANQHSAPQPGQALGSPYYASTLAHVTPSGAPQPGQALGSPYYASTLANVTASGAPQPGQALGSPAYASTLANVTPIAAPQLGQAPSARPGLAQVGRHAVGIDDQPSFKNVTDDAKRSRYVVTIAPQMQRLEKTILKAFDTHSIKQHHITKYNQLPNQMTKNNWRWEGVGRQALGGSAEARARAKYWLEHSLIWVCVPGPGDSAVFYSHIGKLRRFHHSSFTAGQPVVGAGEWIVKNGQLIAINANSGHYQPTIDQLLQSVLHMRAALHADTTVMLWNALTDEWEDVNAQEFLNRRSDGAKYKAHPHHS